MVREEVWVTAQRELKEALGIDLEFEYDNEILMLVASTRINRLQNELGKEPWKFSEEYFNDSCGATSYIEYLEGRLESELYFKNHDKTKELSNGN
jgi:8-oxo-dGTP pyrophosphatase MutT (NUDIX family)